VCPRKDAQARAGPARIMLTRPVGFLLSVVWLGVAQVRRGVGDLHGIWRDSIESIRVGNRRRTRH